MRAAIELLRAEPRARLFFLAYAQSSLGTGAGYVALLLIAYERFHSPWAISLVLMADLLPAMLLGPLFGAAADRWSRRRCVVAGDLIRAAAFVGIGLVGSFEATVALSLLAGAGTGLFTPASLAGLPSLVERRRLAAATSLYGAIADFGYTLGPALAAVLLLFAGSETVIVVNGVTFAASALVLARLRFGAAPAREVVPNVAHPTLLAEARDGLRATAGMPGIRIVLVATGALLFFGGIFNVGELLFATEELGASDPGFSALVALFGLGVIAGSLAGAAGGALAHLKGRYLGGILVMGAGFLASGLAPGFAVAAFAFTLAGVGNGMVLVYERLLIQTAVPDELMGRVFGVKDALTAWAFAVAFLSAGAIIALIGPRGLLVLAGAGGIVVWGLARVALRGTWVEGLAPRAFNAPPASEAPSVRPAAGTPPWGAPPWTSLPSER